MLFERFAVMSKPTEHVSISGYPVAAILYQQQRVTLAKLFSVTEPVELKVVTNNFKPVLLLTHQKTLEYCLPEVHLLKRRGVVPRGFLLIMPYIVHGGETRLCYVAVHRN